MITTIIQNSEFIIMITDIVQGLNSNHKVQSSNLKVQRINSSMLKVQRINSSKYLTLRGSV